MKKAYQYAQMRTSWFSSRYGLEWFKDNLAPEVIIYKEYKLPDKDEWILEYYQPESLIDL